jgi:hypothetical protein
MRATDIVRQVLDLLDQVEGQHDIKDGAIDAEVHVHQNDEPENRFKQILAMLDANSFGPLANSPNEVVAPVSAVTTDAGGGINGPKHPHDIRVKDPSAYPDQQEY